MGTKISTGTKVAYQYRQHHLLGGALVAGEGVVIGETVIGTDLGYAIKPASGNVVHVRCAGVRVV